MRGETDSTGIAVMQPAHLEAGEREYYAALTSMLSRFIGRTGLEETIKCALKDLCKMSGATNGLLYLAPQDEATFGERYEWYQEKVCSQTRLTMLPHDILATWMSALETSESVNIEDVVIADAGTVGYHQDLQNTGIRSLLVLPLTQHDGPDGFLALATTGESASWRSEDVGRFKSLTLALAQAVERKRGDEIMRNVDKVRGLVLDSVSELVTLMDPDLKILWGNRAAAASLGLTPQQLTGRHCYELWNQREKPCVGCPIMASLASGEPESGEIITPDGRMWHLNGYPVRNSAGEIVGVAEVTSDITELKRTAVELRKSEEKFRTLVEHSLQSVAVVQEYRIVFANSALAELSGYSLKELINLRPSEVRALIHPDDQDMVWGRFRDRLEGKHVDSRYAFRIIQKDSSVRWVEMFATCIEYLGRPGVQATMVDITSQKRLDEKIMQEESEQSMAELIS
jgi:PAS domain S-box-containing protein